MNASCFFCGSLLLKNSNIQHYLKCLHCKSLNATEIPSKEILNKYYSKYINGAQQIVPEHVSARISSQLQSMLNHKPNGKFLDVGFGAGHFLREAIKLGCQVYGQEIDSNLLDYVQDLPIQVKIGEFNRNLFENKFDTISVIEVLEHVPNPRELLQEIFASLEPGGILFGSTPNPESMNSRILGSKWSIYNFPEHLNLASSQGLFALLAETGFCEIKISSSGLNPHDLLRALRIWNTSGSMLAEDNWGRVEFGYSLGELSQRRGFSSTRKIIEALLRMTGSGDTLTFVAERFD